MKSEDVAAYLRKNPTFFKEHGEILADIDIEGADPFQQRQIEVLRERHNAEKMRYELVVESARNNMTLEQSLHQLACSLLSRGCTQVTQIERMLKEEFEVEGARLLIGTQVGEALCDEFPLLEKRVAHGSSICDDRVSTTLLNALFGAEAEIASCAFIPLKSSGSSGVLVLGSKDSERFQPGMGPIYLDRIGELVGAAGASEPG